MNVMNNQLIELRALATKDENRRTETGVAGARIDAARGSEGKLRDIPVGHVKR